MRDGLFISYSHHDKYWFEKLLVHLKPFERNNKIQVWHDKKIRVGEKWREAIEKALQSAKVAVLLVSPSFLFSDFIAEHELPVLLERAKKDGLVIFWIAVSASAYTETEIKDYQAAHNPKEPLDTLDAATLNRQLVKICQQIILAMTEVVQDNSSRAPRITSEDDGPKLPVSRPGFRYMLDRYFPEIHRRLTTKLGIFETPPEWPALNKYLSTFEANTGKDIRAKSDPYINPEAKDVPEVEKRLRRKRRRFFTPNQELIKEIAGVSYGGDRQDAMISALSSKSKVVRNLVKRLMKADQPLILLGDPGMGKSLTLQRAAMLIAGRERKRIFPTLCLFIRLGGFDLSPRDASGVWNYVKKVTEKSWPDVLPYLDNLAASERLIIFFDGMDEMNRARYNEYTTALSVFAESTKDRIKTLFSCRITDFSPSFEHYRLVLLPFTYKLIREYLAQYIPGFPIKIGSEKLNAKQLAERLINGELSIQASNPFVLWLLSSYVQEVEDLPESRVQLMDHYNRSNYRRKLDPDGGGAGMDHAFLAWGQIAYEITERNAGAEIQLREVESFLRPEQLVAVQEGKRCGVLDEALDWDPPVIQFQHHRFQEYFTALYFFRNQEQFSRFPWLKKLDAPRWQETMFNLVIMGGGDEALVALTEAINQGINEFTEIKAAEEEKKKETIEKQEELKDDKDKAAAKDEEKEDEKNESLKQEDAYVQETLLADRVELASRILQQTQQRGDDLRSNLLSQTQSAAYLLSEKGNPITQVKMLLAVRIVPAINIWRVAEQPLDSPISWVSQQAYIVTATTDRAGDKSVLEGENPERTLRKELLHKFASGEFLNRLPYFLTIARGLKEKRFRLALAVSLVLTLAQLLASYCLLAIALQLAIPAFTTTEAWVVRSIEKGVGLVRKHEKNEATLAELDRMWSTVSLAHSRFDSVAGEIKQTLDSRWFLLAANVIVFLAFLYSLWHAPGQHSLYIQAAGVLCLMLPLLLWPLWRGDWPYLALALFCGILFVTAYSLAGRIITVLIHFLTLLVLVASTRWANQRIKLFPLLTLVRESKEADLWRTKINRRLYFVAFVAVALVVAFEVDWPRVLEYGRSAYSALPRISGAIIVLIQILAIAIACLVAIAGVVLAVAFVKKLRSSAQFRGEMLGTGGCALILGLVALIGYAGYWAKSQIDWRAVGTYTIETLGLLPSLPLGWNIFTSICLYLAAIGFVVFAISVIVNRRQNLRSTLEAFGCWTGCVFRRIVSTHSGRL